MRQIVKYQPPEVVAHIFQTVITEGKADVIKLFCKNGVNPFMAVDENNPAPIFGLCFRPDLCFNTILRAVFDGMEEYYINRLAGLFKSKRNLAMQPLRLFFDEEKDLNVAKKSQNTLLQEAICQGNVNFSKYLARNSLSEVATKFAWRYIY